MSKPFYSFGIIFKNEIRCLERCLKSLRPLRDALPCEVVMADTGSDDGSREVAEKYADILFDFPWCDDFAAARNAVMDRCSGEWYFSIDADEWLDADIKELVQFSKAKIRSNVGGIMIRNYKSLGPDRDTNYMDFSGIRLARLSTGARYQGCIHERLFMPDGKEAGAVQFGSTLLHHDGYAFASNADMKKKHDRNIHLLDKKLEEDPEDLQTLTECIEATRQMDDICTEYARRAAKIIRRKEGNWGKQGPTVYRNIVSAAKLHKMPELREWVDEAWSLFPNSIFVRIDISYYMFSQCWDEKDYESCIKWGEAYRAGLSDYTAGKYDPSEPLRGVLEYSSPYWERRLLILLADSYARLKEYGRAFAVLQKIDGSQLDEGPQADACVHIALRLHRMSAMGIGAFLSKFWDEINRVEPSANIAEKRRAAFLNAAAQALTPGYREDEAGREGFLRHSYTALIPLEGKCILGDGAAVLDISDPTELEKRLAKQSLGDFPISAIAHVLKHDVAFPPPGRPMSLEEMDALARRLASISGLPEMALAVQRGENLQNLCWRRTLLLAAVRSCRWEDEAQGLALAKAFVELEREFLPVCYADTALARDGLFMLPPLHRFGWYCAQAFNALDAGDAAGYVRLLREGLAVCEGVKDMVEFLIDHTPELKAPSEELSALAEQIRAVLEKFPLGDPAVVMLKQSEAYQKVAHLIEGTAPPVAGGLPQ